MEVLRRYWRTSPDTRGQVSPANRQMKRCLWCPRMPSDAQPDVPASYPRLVVCSQNVQRDANMADRQLGLRCDRLIPVRSSRSGGSELGEASPRAIDHDEIALALVAVERLRERGRCSVSAAGGLQH